MEKDNVEQAEAKLAAYERKNLENIVQNEAKKVSEILACAGSITLQNHLGRSATESGQLTGASAAQKGAVAVILLCSCPYTISLCAVRTGRSAHQSSPQTL